MFLLFLLLSSASGYERLKKDVYPTKYHLTLQPSFEGDYTFHGNLNIHMVVNETNTISLDCEDLNVTSVSLVFDGWISVPHSYVQANNRLIITSETTLRSYYDVELNVTFYGRIRRDMVGFYLSTYQFEGKQRVLGSTHFETNGARKAFPCFDEPSFRANFSLELIIDPNMSAISNLPATSDHVLNGTRRILFAERPSTPTYLVAWIIYEPASYGHFSKNVTTNCDQNKSLIYSIWYEMNYQNETSLALNAAPNIVSALENFTGVPCEAVKYKMDLAAIPDFQAGAMENWEIITFRESALLYNNVTSSVSDIQSVIMIVAHELVHQWFGNLVTPEWWSYTWLNEGFARYLQYVISDQLYPEMNLMEQFLVDRRQIALGTDSPRAHPLSNHNITSQDDIQDMFDVITYDKGASVIHMWRSTIGDEVFRRGIANYLNNVVRLGGVSEPAYLFSALFSNTLQNNSQLGLTWTLQSGYPIVVATESNSTLSLRQIKVTGWNTFEEGQWLIPITLNLNNNRTVSYNLEPNNSLKIQLDPNTSYIINVNQNGFYRVMYHNISRWLPTTTTDLTRSMLIDDAMALSKAGLLPYQTSMTAVTQHLKSSGYFPWISALRAFSTVDDVLQTSELGPRWRELVLNLMDTIMRKVALNDSLSENHILKLHKMNLLKYGCKFGNIDCLVEAGKLASNLSYGTPEKRDALLCAVTRMGNEETWNQIFMRYNSSNSPTEKQSYLRALACTMNRSVIQKFLGMMLTTTIRNHDIVSTVKIICDSPQGAEESFNFIKNNYQQLLNHFITLRNVRAMLSAATKYVNESQLAEIKQMSSVMPELITQSFISNLEQAIIQKKHQIQALSDYLLGTSSTEATTLKVETSTGGTSGNHSNKLNVELTYVLLSLAILYIKSCII
ncbi:uncharacterized protein [Halyomorpha halys]|uniref:uncharacterized protein n=1 Tax=Halyomorpha halys TaxID=286706 RepID=UPI0006D4DDBB|nr:aminopeptidase M1 [Halyomorpha halys]